MSATNVEQQAHKEAENINKDVHLQTEHAAAVAEEPVLKAEKETKPATTTAQKKTAEVKKDVQEGKKESTSFFKKFTNKLKALVQ